ncbi:AbrB/MazE/SpoVT family DNA-binding domain-containing protein [Candidatus Woesearchaeota archaeon]|nr:AbrB/MazE/SpoVT family DNA-binding domain-containing protein [Candidatus Woesearchaeota archaeon]
MLDITKITSKGQVVIPAEIREELGLKIGSHMVVNRVGDLVLMKKVSVADPIDEFDRLVAKGEQFARKKRIKTEQDVVRIIHEFRKKK